MSKQQDDKERLQQVNQQLDDAEQALSAEVVSRLRQSRQMALEQMTPAKLENKKFYLGWRPLGAVAMVMSVLVIMIGLKFMNTDMVSHPDTLNDLPLLTATEEFELYEELEFYQWLEFEDRAG